MFTLYLAGIQTNSHNLVDMFTGNLSDWRQTAFWAAIIAAIGGFVATVTRINIGGFSISPTMESITAGLMALVYVLFVADLLSIVNLVDSKTQDGLKWAYWATWALIVPIVFGYGIAVIEFIKGSD